MKNISVYVKGNRKAPTYYRIYQYFDNIDDCHFRYRTMYAEWLHDKFMPLSGQSIFIKAFAFVQSYLRILIFLLCDCIFKPDVLIIHRRVLARYMPISYKLLLRSIAKRVRIIWDFDDNIIENKEISHKTLNFYSQISSIIVVTNEFLKNLVPAEFSDKVMIMPTTDGDMYRDFEKDPTITMRRLQSFDNALNLVWVATSVNLKYLESIMKELDTAAEKLYKEHSKRLTLNVVCNAPLNYKGKSIIINNIKWSHEKAIQIIYKSHIGIMPLIDNDFTKGKGGFKLIQYMSAGLPCIASNVGYNNSVVTPDMGILINNEDEWIDSIVSMNDKEHWKELSVNAYGNWLRRFSYEKNLSHWNKLIH